MSDVVFEEKLTVKEMLPGFFEFNQYFFNKGDDTADLTAEELTELALWSSKLIYDTNYEWFSYTFTGELRTFISSLSSGSTFDR